MALNVTAKLHDGKRDCGLRLVFWGLEWYSRGPCHVESIQVEAPEHASNVCFRAFHGFVLPSLNLSEFGRTLP